MQLTKILCIGFLFTCAALFLAGCETVPAKELLKIEASKVVVIPVESLHRELKRVSGPVYAELVEQVRKQGFQVTELSDTEYEQLRQQALEISGSIYDPKVGAFLPLKRATFIKAVVDLSAQQYDHDIVLIPELVLRTADVNGDKAEWDDVKREVSVISESETTYKLPEKIKALSLRLGAYTNKGAEVYLNFSGISLPYHLRHVNKKMTLELKENYFTVREIKEGVNIALQPFKQQVSFKNDR